MSQNPTTRRRLASNIGRGDDDDDDAVGFADRALREWVRCHLTPVERVLPSSATDLLQAAG